MAHEIDSLDVVGLRGKQAWHGLGVVIQDDLTAVEASQRFGLTWPVDQYPLRAVCPDGTMIDVPSHVANIRTADNNGNSIAELLGIVGADYSVCQNRELAEFTDALAQTGKVVVESCGSIRNGKRVWFLARGESFDIGTSDTIHPYLLVSNGHDGTQAIRVTPTTIRVVCSNTLHMVIPNADGSRPDTAAITIRHSGKIADKLEQARRSLRYYGSTLARNRELFEALQDKRFDQQQTLQLFADTYAAFWDVATPDDLASGDAKVRRNAENRLSRMKAASELFLARYRSEQSILDLGDTAWAAFNAVTGFIQHDKSARGADDSARVSRRIESNLFGVNVTRTHEVLAQTLALAG